MHALVKDKDINDLNPFKICNDSSKIDKIEAWLKDKSMSALLEHLADIIIEEGPNIRPKNQSNRRKKKKITLETRKKKKITLDTSKLIIDTEEHRKEIIDEFTK
jgi:hypothetical protein